MSCFLRYFHPATISFIKTNTTSQNVNIKTETITTDVLKNFILRIIMRQFKIDIMIKY